MRIPINLASQPFQRVRAMLVTSIAASLLLTATLAVLILLAIADRNQTADLRQDVNRLTREVKRTDLDQTKLSTTLRKPENIEVLERSVFINTLLYRKGVSWTGIFSDLEKVLPYNVKVVQIRLPNFSAQNEVMLDMTVACEAPEAEIRFLQALENSQLFSDLQPRQTSPPSMSDPLYRYRVLVKYAQKH